MAKLLLLLLIALAGYLIWRGRRRGDDDPGPRSPASPEAIVGCAHCRIHVPLSESLPAEGRYYCCEEHRRLGPAKPRQP